MTKQNNNHHRSNKNDRGKLPEVDNLLKQSFPDDLPPHVQARMKDRMDRFRDELDMPVLKARKSGPRELLDRFLASFDWMVAGKGLLAAASVLLVILGGFLRVSGPRSALADSVSSLGTSAFTLNQLHRAGELTYRIQAKAEDAEPLPRTYLVRQVSPRKLWLGIEEPSSSAAKEPNRPKGRWVKLENAGDLRQDALYRPAAPFVFGGLKTALRGQWLPLGYERQGECELGLFRVKTPGPRPYGELTVAIDMCTALPVRITIDKAIQQ